MSEKAISRTRVAIVAILVFAAGVYLQSILTRFGFYRGLYGQYPFYVPEGLKSLLQVVLCLGALIVTYRIGLRAAVRELALEGPILRALLFAVVVSSPMLIGLALTRHVARGLVAADLVYFEAVAPFAEEVLFRGYAFRQLHLRARWPFLAAVLLTSVIFGLGHIEKGTMPGQVIAIFLITGTGGAFFAWLLVKWQNLWVPFATHLCMNLWWDLFGMGETAWGGWFPLTLQISTMAMAVGLTIYLRSARRPAALAAILPAGGR